MRVATWNVLHRIHAVNWSEPAIATHVDEDMRVAAIADRVAELARDCVVALQEVSGDQLAAIRAACSNVHAAPFPRVPRYRADPAAAPRDPTEFLVVIAPDVRSTSAYTFPTDGGKGLLAAELASGVLVICTHVTYGDKRPAQLAEIAARVTAHAGPCVVLGDFNADRATVIAELGADFVAAQLPPGLSTRPRAVHFKGTGSPVGSLAPAAKSQDIDHVIAWRGRLVDVAVHSAGGLSDHNIVQARLL